MTQMNGAPPRRRRRTKSIWSADTWRRTGRFRWLRILRLSDSPQRIARGVFAGTFIAFSPFFGLHLLLAPLLALLMKGSVLASLAAAFICNPLTFPVMAVMCYGLGTLLTGGEDAPDLEVAAGSVKFELRSLREDFGVFSSSRPFDWDAFFDAAGVIFLPYLVGGAVIGVVAGGLLGWLSFRAISAYQGRPRRAVAESAAKADSIGGD